MKKFIDIILGGVLILYCIIMNSLSSTTIAFSEVLISIGIILIAYHFTKDKIKDIKHFDKVFKVIKIGIACGVVLFIIVESFIIAYPKKSEANTDYIIVLGAGLANRTQVSLTLKDRLDAAITCVNKYENDGYIVVSGGKGEDEDISEAEAMKGYLVKEGIPEDKILMEDKSINTLQNLKFSREIIEKHGNKDISEFKIKIVTTDFHALRSSILAKKNGYSDIEVYSSDTIVYLIPVFYLRESLAVVKSTIFD